MLKTNWKETILEMFPECDEVYKDTQSKDGYFIVFQDHVLVVFLGVGKLGISIEQVFDKKVLTDLDDFSDYQRLY